MIHKISRGPYILHPRGRVFYALKTYTFSLRPYIFRQDRKFSAQDRIFSARTVYFTQNVYFTFQDRIFYYLIMKLLAVPMLVKHVGEKCMLAKNLYVGEI